MKIRHIQLFLLLVISLTLMIGITIAKAEEEETESDLSIRVAGVGVGIEERTLIGARDVFPEGSKVYFFTWILGGQAGDHVSHIWIHEEVEKFRIDLSVGGPSWRTWSNKTMRPGSIGSWRVEVLNESGDVLESITFECTPVTSD